MSSTNRGAKRNPADYYATRPEAIELFLREWAKDEPLSDNWSVLDPCAGGTVKNGAVIVPMSYPDAIWKCFHKWKVSTVDIRQDSPAERIADYLFPTGDHAGQYDLVISNPPFSLAVDFINEALLDVHSGGFVVMLLRLNFFGTDDRKSWIQSHMPSACYVHSKRMGFNWHRTDLPPEKRRETDSIEYAHFVWQKDIYPKWAKLRVI